MREENKKLAHLILKDRTFQCKEIRFLEADNSSTFVHLSGGRKVCISANMLNVLSRINNDHIVRIHRSYCINLFKKPFPNKNHYILEDGTKVPMSRRYAKQQNGDDDWENYQGIGSW